MITVNQDQFKKQYGETGVKLFGDQPTQKPSFIARVGADLNKRGENVSNLYDSNQSFPSKTLQLVGQGAGFVNDIIGEGLKSTVDAIPDQVKEPIKSVGVDILKTPIGQLGVEAIKGGIDSYNKFKEVHPEAAGNLEAVLNIASLLPVGKAAELGTEAAVKGAQAVGDAATVVKDVAVDSISSAKNKILPAVTEESKLATAIKDATPNYETSTAIERKKLLPRVQEGGTFKGRTVASTPLETEAGTELSKVLGYDPNATKLSKYQLAKKEVETRATQLETDLGKEKIIVPKKEIVSRVRTAIDAVPEESLLLQKSDPAIRNYMRVLNNAASESEGNLKGVLKLRKKLDAAYENARGKQAFGSDKIAALDEVHRASRDALTQYLIDHASTDVQASLRSQWNLYRALDQLQLAAEKESGSTIGRLMQKYPITTKVAKMGGRVAGLGAGVHLIE